jgi:biotin synthase
MAIKDWTKQEILEVYNTPLMELIYKAAEVHKQHHTVGEVQVSSLLSIKTGGCPEDCSYCPQAARYHTEVKVHKLMSVPEVDEAANNAKAGGASRMCLGAAWREVRDNRDFDTVLDMVKTINSKGLEVCATLGMVTEDQAKRLAEAGLYAYNHNIDTSEENYENIISTRTFDDRLNTIHNVRKAGLTVCSGGIIGMGEKVEDRVGMLYTLSLLRPQPESVPIWDMVRMIATARIVLPRTAVRLSAGRLSMSMEGQALCFMAGANSIFAGEKLLTTPNPLYNQDMEMFDILGLSTKKAFVDKLKKEELV